MSVSLIEAAERKWGKSEIVQIPDDVLQKKLEAYETLKKKLRELPEREVLASSEELEQQCTF